MHAYVQIFGRKRCDTEETFMAIALQCAIPELDVTFVVGDADPSDCGLVLCTLSDLPEDASAAESMAREAGDSLWSDISTWGYKSLQIRNDRAPSSPLSWKMGLRDAA